MFSRQRPDARPKDNTQKISKQLHQIERQIARMQQQLDRGAPAKRTKIRDAEFLEAAKRVAADGRTLLGPDRLWTLWQAARNVAHLELPAAEVGSYRGGSAYFLAAALRDRIGHEVPFDVVDTFSGHPEGRFSEHDAPSHVAGLFSKTNADEVRQYLSAFELVEVHVGEFGAVKDTLANERYGLVHLDVDLYEATLEGLRFFGARMPPGAIAVLDDFDARKCPGIRRAAEEFLSEEPGWQTWNALTEQLVLVKR